jgi:hypothetical protein
MELKTLNASTDALAEAEADMAAMGRQARVATKNCPHDDDVCVERTFQ